MRRSHLYDDVLKIFSDERIMCEYPLDIKFEDERAVDFGGVSRHMLSGFWEEAYRKIYDGCSLPTPVIHTHKLIHKCFCLLAESSLMVTLLPASCL